MKGAQEPVINATSDFFERRCFAWFASVACGEPVEKLSMLIK